MDAQAAGRGALIARVGLDHLHQIRPLEFAHGEFERDPLLYHLHDEFMQLAAHRESNPKKVRIKIITDRIGREVPFHGDVGPRLWKTLWNTCGEIGE